MADSDGSRRVAPDEGAGLCVTSRRNVEDIDAAVAGWTLPKAFAAAAGRFPDVRSGRVARPRRGWEGLTFAQYREVVRDLTLGLAGLGLVPGRVRAHPRRRTSRNTRSPTSL